MAVATTVVENGPYVANGVTTTFAYTFTPLSEAEVVVIGTIEGVETELAGYALSNIAGPGNVVFNVAPAAGQTITVRANPSFLQELSFDDQEGFTTDQITEGFDRAAQRDLIMNAVLEALQVAIANLPASALALLGGVGSIEDAVADGLQQIGAQVSGIVWGSGDPTADIGENGNAYVDTDGAGVLWGPKVGGVWSAKHFTFASSSSAVDMPAVANALAAWYVDEYVAQSGGGRVVPNALADAPSQNLLGPSNRHFASFAGSNVVVTDGYGTGPDLVPGSSSRLQGTGVWQLNFPGTGWATASYMQRLYIRSLTGVSQTLVMGKGGATSNITVTTAWQDFSKTPALVNGDALVVGAAGSADVEVFLGRIYKSGTEPAAPQDDLPAGHMILGATPLAASPAVAGGLVTVTGAGQKAFAVLPQRTTFNQITVAAQVQVEDNTTEFHEIISDLTSAFNLQFAAQRSTVSGKAHPEAVFGGVVASLAGDGYWDLTLIGGLHIVGFTCDTALGSMTLYLDNVPLYTVAGAFVAPTMGEFVFFSNVANIKLAAAAIWDTALTPAQFHQEVNHLRYRAGALAYTPVERVWCAVGDSITAGLAVTNNYVYGANATLNGGGEPRTVVRNLSTGGADLAYIDANYLSKLAAISAQKASGQVFIVTIADGVNDINTNFASYGNSMATWLAAYMARCAALKLAGWKVGVMLVAPSTITGFNATRATVNAALTAHLGTEIDFLINPWGDAGYATVDGTHPTDAFQLIMKNNYVIPAIQANS